MTTDIQSKAMEILSALEGQGIPARLLGGMAIKIHCHNNRELFERPIPDIDFVSFAKDRGKIEKLMKKLGFQPAEMFNYVHPNRLLFINSGDGTRVDVFLEVFDMCHVFNFRDRILLEKPTLTPTDLLITKLQIVELNEKDLKDIVILLRDHQLSEDDTTSDRINFNYIANLCRRDWGIYRTFKGSIARVSGFLSSLPIDGKDKDLIQNSLSRLLESIEAAPKTTKWKMRARIGERRIWYNLPESRATKPQPLLQRTIRPNFLIRIRACFVYSKILRSP